MAKYVALLRGINVGGKNIIKMVDLKKCFEGMGFLDVQTYIQSGNVIFSSKLTQNIKLETLIEKTLKETFKYNAKVVVVTDKDLQTITNQVPKDFGLEPQKYKYDVIFLKPGLNAQKALELIPINEGVDNAHAGQKVLYFTRLVSKLTQSHLNKIVSSSIYQDITIRNWNTTTKLASLCV